MRFKLFVLCIVIRRRVDLLEAENEHLSFWVIKIIIIIITTRLVKWYGKKKRSGSWLFCLWKDGRQGKTVSLFTQKKDGLYRDLLKKISNLETQLALLKGNKEEAIYTLSNISLHQKHDCSSVKSKCWCKLELVLR